MSNVAGKPNALDHSGTVGVHQRHRLPARIATVGLSLVQSPPLEPPALAPVGFSAEKAKVFALLIMQYGFIGLASLVLTYPYYSFVVLDRTTFVAVSVPSATKDTELLSRFQSVQSL